MPMIGLIARPYPMTYVGGTNTVPWSANFPATNMVNNDFGRVGKSSSVANNGIGFFITFDLGSSRPVDTLALLWHNLRSNDIVAVRAGDTLAQVEGSSPLYQSAVVSPVTGSTRRDDTSGIISKFLMTLTSPVTARYWCFNIGMGAAGLTPQISRAFIGKKAVFGVGAQRASFSANDFNQKITLESGEERSTEDQLLIKPVVSLDLRYATQSELNDVLGQYILSMGTSRPLLITPDATGAYIQDTLVFGRPEKVIQAVSDIYDVWEFTATVPSLGP